jgi:hypothetical protein
LRCARRGRRRASSGPPCSCAPTPLPPVIHRNWKQVDWFRGHRKLSLISEYYLQHLSEQAEEFRSACWWG